MRAFSNERLHFIKRFNEVYSNKDNILQKQIRKDI